MNKYRTNGQNVFIKITLSLIFSGAVIFSFPFFEKVSAENTDLTIKTEKNTAIENALYTRAEFFGAQAFVPFPTEKARENLAVVAEKYKDDAEIYRKMSELDEKLEKFDTAEQELNKFVELQKNNRNALESLADFYERRGAFEKEAETLEKILGIAPKEEKTLIFSRLIEFAGIHELEKYLAPEFYQKIVADNPAVFPIIEQLIDKLSTEKNYAEALKILREYKEKFPGRKGILLKKEIEILLSMKNKAEAEKVYQAAFDPFWTDEETDDYYQFLKAQDRFRAYGSELKTAFKRDSADFDTAIRLLKFRQRDGVYDNDSAAAVILQIEKSRREKNIAWKPEELMTAARLLLADGDGDSASRFLYTLHLQNALAPQSELRAKILYQLFELLSDSGEQRISLTKGDLRFYEDVGTSDLHPGITSGILSLIFSDTEPRKELAAKNLTATKYFNHAAAYRIFLAYKEEYPTSPQLAQMYLDIVRFYTATKETKIAAETLAEFEQRYEKSSDYPRTALKLADAFASTGQPKKELETYRRILDYLGKQGKSLAPKIGINEAEADSGENYSPPNFEEKKAQISNQGIEIPNENEKKEEYYYDANPTSLRDYLGDKNEEVTYSDILKRLVKALSKDKKTDEILALYSGEIGKYPDEQWLYEQRLEWLEQANLVDEQLKVYQAAIARFKTKNWQDKLARWFLRRDRKQEFADFSQNLIEKLDDTDTRNYLEEFVRTQSGMFGFDNEIYLKLYATAHERFPHNINFVNGLLNFYKNNKRENEWRKLSAEYYFESKSVRDLFVKNLAEKGELRNYLNEAREKCCAGEPALETLPYSLFRADAAAHLANFEEAVDAYTKLNELYPHTAEFQERLLNFTRSFGQRNRGSLAQAANIARAQAEFSPSSASYRTRSGELQAELGNYNIARNEWEKLIETAPGEAETYLDTATVYWDYFQYDDALKTIKKLREKTNDDTLYAFQTGAILEAKHELPAAIGEYVKSLDASEDEDFSQSYRAKNRLTTLAGRKEENLRFINASFETERRRRTDDSDLVLAYADFLQEAKQKSQAEAVLKQEISGSTNRDFLESAREFFSTRENKNGEQTALRRLGQTASNPRGAISYKLQLADSFLEENRRDEAKKVVAELLSKFPTNYGVLSESADIYWRINAREDAIEVLQNGVNRGKGKFQYIFSRKLAAKLILQGRYDSAEQILIKLHDEDAGDTEVFRELTNIYINQNKADALKKVFGETLTALKNQDTERRELNAQIAEFRTQMIGAFTRMKNYGAAVEQYIEIINREPNDEESVENAVNYVKRYGGGETLLAYYKKTAAEAYKNYRWNVVLAQIFEANNDLDNAARNYKTAIENQPEMPELYAALADIETRRKNYDAALENINKILELTNGDTQYVKLKIKVLEKAGRNEEAAVERAKLPAAERPKQTLSDQFLEARNLQSTAKSDSAAAYRQAFEEFFQNPLAHDLTTADVAGYVSAARSDENLDAISVKLWNLREKLIAEADGRNLINAGKARKQLQILDGAMPEAIGNIAETTAASDENSALENDLSRRIDEVFQKSDRFSTLSLIENIARKSSFGALTEKILIARKDRDFADNTSDNYHIRLRELVNFYGERGMYRKILDVLETERKRDNYADKFSYSQLIAENARLVGDIDKELHELRENYQSASGEILTGTDEMTARYLEFLYQNKREELGSLAKQYSPHQLQFINFLLAKGEGDSAHEAIENSKFSQSWKLGRNAETSLALREYSGKNECYFCDALRLAPIGEFIAQRPDKNAELVGGDWFRLINEYGEWLYFAPSSEMKNDAKNFLPAMTENNPNSAEMQMQLGAFYLTQKDAKNALEHLNIALEISPEDKNVKANLGAAYFQTGDEKTARKFWSEIIAGENPGVADIALYLQTLSNYGLQTEARETMFPFIINNLKENDGSGEYYYQKDRQKLTDETKNLIRRLAKSFDDEKARSVYFQKLVSAVSQSNLLSEILINESLITKENRAPFYEILIERSPLSGSSDYDYEAIVQKSYGTEEAEQIFDLENDFKITEPENERVNWQKEYLAYLLETGANIQAETLVSSIEYELDKKRPRPEWLRLAKMKVQIKQGKQAQTLEDAKTFIGIKIKYDANLVKPPSVERLNGVLQILRDEGYNAEARDLLKSFYLRQLALEQIETASFIGLAQIYFEENNLEEAFEILRLLNEAADETTKPEALAKLEALPKIQLFASDNAKLSGMATTYSVNKNNALEISAETFEKFGRINEAVELRQKLLETAPENAENRLELARLFARNNNQTETVKLLADVINNRNTNKNLRWKAVWVSREIVENKTDLLNKIRPADGELRNALEVLINNGIEIKVENPDSHLWFFAGLIAGEFRQTDYAINAFQNSLIADSEMQNPFGAENANQQLMRLYIEKNQPNAALKLADADKTTKSDALLDLLSKTAESIGDFAKAIEFEKAKSKEIDTEKVAQMEDLQKQKIRKATDFTVDLENVTQSSRLPS